MKFFTLYSCGEPVVVAVGDAFVVPLYTTPKDAEEALMFYVHEGTKLGFDDAGTTIEEVVVARPVQPVSA